MSSTYRYWYRDGHRDTPDDGSWTLISRRAYNETHGAWDVAGFTAGPAKPPPWAQDLLRCARAVFLADKLSSRSEADDGWTRAICLSVPVTDPELWNQRARPIFEKLLGTATGDYWAMRFHRSTGEDVPDLLFYPENCRVREVALFSGGLDSLSWALRRVRDSSRGPLQLVMFNDPPLGEWQQAAQHLIDQRKDREVHLTGLPQKLRGEESRSRPLEHSSRTRGFLYTVAALHVAAVNGLETAEVPENGQVAFNPPLSPARAGACSTRSVHPWTLYLLNRLVRTVGGTVWARNPLWRETKGVVCKEIANARVSPTEAAAFSVSCGRSPRLYGGGDIAHCGCCFPCLVRRSGLLRGYGRDETAYDRDPWELPPSGRRDSDPTEDWRALKRWLRAPFCPVNVASDQPLPPGWSPQHLHTVIAEGRRELSSLVGSHADRRPLPEA